MCRKFLCLVSFILVLGAFSSASGALPKGWRNSDVGTPLPGSADESAGVFTVTGDGGDIWDNSDNFHYAYKLLDGDGTMVARVLSIGGPSGNEWRKAGVMIRETLTGPSAHAYMAMTATTGGPGWAHASSFQGRTTTAGGSVNNDLIPTGYAGLPWWVRITRSGNNFTGAVSPDGITWTDVATRETIMTANVYIGLAVTSHDGATLSTCTFDNVSFTGNVHGLQKASNPDPTVGEAIDAEVVAMKWEPGDSAALHDVYVSTSFNDVNTATTSSGGVYKGRQAELLYPVDEWNPMPVTRGLTYYWRIDEVNGTNTWRGDIWSFWVVSNSNYNPTPADHATFVPVTTDLSWSKGNWAVKGHIVYYSTSFDIVNNAVPGSTTGTPGYLAPGSGQTATSLIRTIPGDLLYNTTYYWRADAVQNTPPMTPGNTHKGDIWEFKTTVPGTGSILRELWENITPTGTTSVADLYNWPAFPSNPTQSITIPSFDTTPALDNYGGRIHGWVFAPQTGDYTFYLATDDNGELWLSTNDNPENAQLIASENSWAGPRAWQMGPEMSAPVPLVGGNKYYISALWKEGTGGDNCAVGWTGPGISAITVIPGDVLMPFVQYWAYAPLPADEAYNVSATTTIDWLAGAHAASHNIYFGTVYADVKAGTGGTFKGNVPLATHVYDPPGTLEAGKLYYWKIDEVNDLHAAKKWEGPVWVFRVAGGAGGLLGAYYQETGAGAAPAAFETFVLSRIDPKIDFGWGNGSPDPLVDINDFSCRWRGQVEAPFSEDYIFYPATDDGERLWVDGQLVVDQWVDQGTTEVASAPIALVAGQKYDIVMEQYENEGGAAAYLRWSSPSTAKQIIPPIWLWPPTKATNPVPSDGSTSAPPQQLTLSWTAGVYAAAANGHKVYFDADQAKVIARAGCQVNGTSTTNPSYLLLSSLGLEETYYWAVDEVNGVKSWPGDTWSFTTANNKVIDDMELYPPNVQDSNIYQVWVDGAGDCGSIAGNNSGALVDIATVATLAPVHGGQQAMKLVYDNDGTVDNPCPPGGQTTRLTYSKVEAQVAQLPSGIGSDWTSGGVTKILSLWFYGDPLNSIEPMWVQLTDASNNKFKVLYGAYADEAASDVNEASWHEWLIDLADFTGVTVSNVKSIAIGVGDEGPAGGGSGTLYFDDIRLYTPRCVLTRREADYAKLDYAPEGPVSGDCIVDYRELAIMSRDWLADDLDETALWTTGSWTNGDVGDVGTATGSFTLLGGDAFTIVGAGADIWGTADAFHYAWKPLSGDGQITVRLTSLDHTNDWAKAGVMIRDTLDANSVHAMMIGTPGTPNTNILVAFQYRPTTGADSVNVQTAGPTPPYCLRLARRGDTFTGYYYSDGKWVQQGSATIPMTDPVYIGMAVTSHTAGTLCTAKIDRACSTDFIPADLVPDDLVNFKDYSELILNWLDETEWPLP